MAQRLPRPSDPLDGARESLQRLRAARDWDEATPVVHVNVQPPARRSTPPAPKPSEGTLLVVLRIVGQGVQRMPPIGVVLIFAMLILAWVYLAVHGKAPIP
jgi:hypothetical protein